MSSPEAEMDTECPVCGKLFSPHRISIHVNECLGDDSPGPDKMSKNDIKKSEKSDWNFLSGYNKKSSSGGKIPSGSGEISGPGINTVTVQTSGSGRKRKNSDVESNAAIFNFRSKKTDVKEYHEKSNALDKAGVPASSNIKEDKQNWNIKHDFKENSITGKQNISWEQSNVPLAERMRPKTLENFIGHKNVVGEKTLLHSLLVQGDKIPSMIVWGPPGCGKTTLSKIIAQTCKDKGTTKFVNLSATSASVSDVKEVVKIAKNDSKMLRKKTILFLDEIHRFNKLQQDVLLPHVENGTLTLIGATTENPSFQVNNALLSRCRVVTLEKLESENIKAILLRALAQLCVTIKDKETNTAQHCTGHQSSTCFIEAEAIEVLSGMVDGDARAALNGLQITVESKIASRDKLLVSSQGSSHKEGIPVLITVSDVKEGLQKSHVLYDRKGEEHYSIISALIKSMRGSDSNAALYWLARMVEGGEDPMFIARRLVIFASEDVGLADAQALVQAVSTMQACQFVGMPECSLNLAQCVVYMCRAAKSVEVYKALGAARECVRQHKGPLPPVPLHLRNASNKFLKTQGYGKGYKYPPDFDGAAARQEYLPTSLAGIDFFKVNR